MSWKKFVELRLAEGKLNLGKKNLMTSRTSLPTQQKVSECGEKNLKIHTSAIAGEKEIVKTRAFLPSSISTSLSSLSFKLNSSNVNHIPKTSTNVSTNKLNQLLLSNSSKKNVTKFSFTSFTPFNSISKQCGNSSSHSSNSFKPSNPKLLSMKESSEKTSSSTLCKSSGIKFNLKKSFNSKLLPSFSASPSSFSSSSPCLSNTKKTNVVLQTEVLVKTSSSTLYESPSIKQNLNKSSNSKPIPSSSTHLPSPRSSASPASLSSSNNKKTNLVSKKEVLVKTSSSTLCESFSFKQNSKKNSNSKLTPSTSHLPSPPSSACSTSLSSLNSKSTKSLKNQSSIPSKFNLISKKEVLVKTSSSTLYESSIIELTIKNKSTSSKPVLSPSTSSSSHSPSSSHLPSPPSSTSFKAYSSSHIKASKLNVLKYSPTPLKSKLISKKEETIHVSSSTLRKISGAELNVDTNSNPNPPLSSPSSSTSSTSSIVNNVSFIPRFPLQFSSLSTKNVFPDPTSSIPLHMSHLPIFTTSSMLPCSFPFVSLDTPISSHILLILLSIITYFFFPC